MADRYSVQEPPRVFGRDMAQYLSSEFHRIEYSLHGAAKGLDGATDAGPHNMVATPTAILTYTANKNIKAGAFVFFECTVNNPNNQLDSVIFEVVIGANRQSIGSMMIDQTTTAKFSTSAFITNAISKGTVVTIEAYRNKRDGMIVTNSELTILEI